ncbi:MAG: hypothetical protein Ta2B_30830 [Termitinemataceae bacterium]|nr:MAG: hypothetical protein Ta2B_30830 [Termitinemataceae bacterium]
MNSYKLVSIKKFPVGNSGVTKKTAAEGALPGFTRSPQTALKIINTDYYGFELFEFEHEMIFKESGTAFGFIEDEPKMMEFFDYLKKFTIKLFLKRNENFAFLSAQSEVVRDLLKITAKNADLGTEIEEVLLDMQHLRLHVDDYLGAWFRKVSTRVTSSALFGSDLTNEPIYQQLLTDGAILTSVFIPYKNMTIQLNDKAGISSHQKVESIIEELSLIQSLKTEIIDNIIDTTIKVV